MDDPTRFPEFTVRDLNRHFATVLEAGDRLGGIRSRKGRVYELRPETPPLAGKPGEVPDFAARRRALGMPRMTPEQRELLNRMICGEWRCTRIRTFLATPSGALTPAPRASPSWRVWR